ncbi:MAG: tRNA (adenosine(37)-N6)-dimethylallyltransferase MiaA [Sulfurimicrobium sp.]|nr:tRNA (adenosine(37)-N6)-dimethylallyltransferase MiaA [Sulfurimicrobium sp.]MDP1704412.1 tRNA (adenosine(37)-N6)-dimethylallyltransferase MiaA [Sulfurimicrobium sp.]MDP2199081.1 tRNA (adenosine(37)-N6)-dimethylallyltransferase MiaA [Sulfurimicrobium sp.]MDP2962138.1 tRNA (adenosine(37)-N6)-dimethylallyltransferase MiaA [Sulfurimicrobium sp.]MDZ7655187.1 tRNA (adenosine(37)-N6)-dimethylallyltransferase MiaA [Sulfurimicrobium sp.]
MNTLPPAIFLMGPTASGKTGVAVELVQHLPVEIISVDSALVYRDMDIGTAKPDAATLAVAPHHLIDIIDPTLSYSAAQFRNDALSLMAEITARGNIPLLVGGTMLYFKVLREGLNDLPQADPALRAELEERAQQHGWPAMHRELARLDPETAARLKPTDAQRIQRALEVCLLSGKTMSGLLALEQEAELPYRLIQLALLPGDRAVLHERIAQRFDAMLKQDLVGELEYLRKRYALTPDLPSMRCVGYRQAWQYLEGECNAAEMRELGVIATRQLAKRQLTWLRGMEGVIEFDCLAADLAGRVRDYISATIS